MEKLYEAWRDYDVAFLYLYTREPHPGFYEIPQTKNIDERKKNAKKCKKDLGMTLPWIIDDMKSSIQRAYGGLPNCAYIIDSKGKVFYKEAWASAEKLNEKLKELFESKPEYKKNAVKHVEKSIQKEKESEKRIVLAEKLAKLACEDACESLTGIFKEEKELETRAKLVGMFALTKQKKCIGFLIGLLDSSEEDIRKAAIETLVQDEGGGLQIFKFQFSLRGVEGFQIIFDGVFRKTTRIELGEIR